MLRLSLPVVAALLAGTHLTASEELLPPNKPIAEAVDHYIDAQLQAGRRQARPAGRRRHPGPPADARPGRPHSHRRRDQAFVESTDPDKRVRLVDRLMASPGFVPPPGHRVRRDADGRQPGPASATTWSGRAPRTGPGTRSSAS